MDLKTLTATMREGQGKGASRRARSNGQVPAVVYGHGIDAASLLLDRRSFSRMVQEVGSHAVVQLEVENSEELSGPVQLRDLQRHPLHEHIMHVDCVRVRLDQRIQTIVPLTLTGRSKGVIEGGILDQSLRDIEIECLAVNIPQEIVVDTTEWDIGTTVHVNEITAPEGVVILVDEGRTVASIHMPRLVVEETEEEVEGEEGAAETEEGTEEAAEES